ncbi:MAG: diaminobutyrate acetyltransferase [Halioglobus sp.]|nr:diaminobutyrate acetyltransferase [Halioglobus sp.]
MTPDTGSPRAVLRPPEATDGTALHQLVSACPPLDENSVYCNLLQCTHFAQTSVVAQAAGNLVGAITGYLVPARRDTLFVWQVAVAQAARGQGLAQRMLHHLIARAACSEVTHLETTVTGTNDASWALFEGFARDTGSELQRSPLFEQTTHFHGQHETEVLARIGPLPQFDQRQPTTDNSVHQKENTA